MYLLLFFFFSAIRFVNCCDPETISANVSSHRFREKYHDRCEYIVEAHPTTSIGIELNCGYQIDIWLQFQVNGVEHEIYVTQLSKRGDCFSKSYYHSPQNVGVRLKVHNNRYYSIDLKIKRTEVGNEICKFPYIVVGLNDTLIQEPERSLEQEVFCAYRLVPDISDESSNEILINFETSIPYQVKQHLNGTIGDVEDEYESKIFPLEVIDLTFTQSDSIPRISASLVHISCSCGETLFSNFSENNMMNIRSPGFPSANCPLKECQYTINYTSTDPEVLLFDVRADLLDGDQLKMRENKYNNLVIDYSVYKPTPTNFTFAPRGFSITYKANEEIADRFFEINVTRIPVSEECRCSSYLDKSYKTSGNVSFTIPKTCKFVFCNWKVGFNKYNYERADFRVSMVNPNENDMISYNNERFAGSKLMHEMFYSTEKVPVYVEFRRFNLTNDKDTQLSISWNFTKDCACPGEQLFLHKNEVATVKTPNYPDNYCSNTKCWKYITAPNDTSIELTILNLQLENFHDFLQIYDENSNLIAELTGTFQNHTIVSTGNVLKLFFKSDVNENFKGYLIHVTSREKSSASSLLLLSTVLLLVVLLIIILLCSLKHCRTRRARVSI